MNGIVDDIGATLPDDYDLGGSLEEEVISIMIAAYEPFQFAAARRYEADRCRCAMQERVDGERFL